MISLIVLEGREAQTLINEIIMVFLLVDALVVWVVTHQHRSASLQMLWTSQNAGHGGALNH